MIKPGHALYRCEQIRHCEQQAQYMYSLDEHELMSRAGFEAYSLMRDRYPDVQHIAVFCGSGNNAGDGYVLARLAHEDGLAVTVYQCKSIETLPAAARAAALKAMALGIECQSADDLLESEHELIIDALLGIGLKGAVQGIIATAIHQINSSQLPVFSLDIPSGLNGDTGVVINLCVKASQTVTFIAPKAGMYTMDGPEYCGTIHCKSLQLEPCIAKLKPQALLLNSHVLPCLPLPKRHKNAHKGDFGSVLIIGGGPGMPGAVSLAAKAAMRVGAGAVSIATCPEYAEGALPLLPEAMIWGIKTPKELKPLLAKATVCIIGPGLGETDWAKALFLEAIRSQLPMIIDASALRLLSEHPQRDDNWILTPHPGEAAALLSCSVSEIQTDRYQAAAQIQRQYGGVVILKGCGTVIQVDEEQRFICSEGNPGMATAGMGDVLSGIIAGFCAQGLSLPEAAKSGVWAHAAAGDKVAQTLWESGMIATDLLDVLPQIINCSTI